MEEVEAEIRFIDFRVALEADHNHRLHGSSAVDIYRVQGFVCLADRAGLLFRPVLGGGMS